MHQSNRALQGSPWLSLQIKRTEGVSSTDIVGRMLTCTRVNALFKEVRG